jgi:hypothetical protein
LWPPPASPLDSRLFRFLDSVVESLQEHGRAPARFVVHLVAGIGIVNMGVLVVRAWLVRFSS